MQESYILLLWLRKCFTSYKKTVRPKKKKKILKNSKCWIVECMALHINYLPVKSKLDGYLFGRKTGNPEKANAVFSENDFTVVHFLICLYSVIKCVCFWVVTNDLLQGAVFIIRKKSYFNVINFTKSPCYKTVLCIADILYLSLHIIFSVWCTPFWCRLQLLLFFND